MVVDAVEGSSMQAGRATRQHQAVIDLRDPPDAVTALTPSGDPAARAAAIERHRASRVAAFALLVVLNVLDLASTAAFLDKGLPEGNPLADAMITNGSIGWAKALLLLALGARILNSRPRLATTCALWFVTGVYTTVVAVNLVGLASA